jgi:hypothetical protein
MALPPFDTMNYYQALREAGLTYRQAHILTVALQDVVCEVTGKPRLERGDYPKPGPEDMVNPEAMMKQVEEVILNKCIDAVKAKMARAVTPEQDGINVGLGIALGALEELMKKGH